MKYLLPALALTLFVSAPGFAAKQITHEESSGYTKIGDLSLTQDGTPTVGHKDLSKEVNKKCEETGNVKPADCFYVIVAATGDESNHKNVNIEVFKK
ncbi:hypothetical protein KC222_16730 [Cedecea davisae]|uniref:DUF1471 domain-containing protein n=1 Tax=Cedecea davisae TaxID=158484 RepID=A0ABS6DLH4_9ENTR|nr:hypothetical protein [Cedecea davisae]MBU4683654.1 hypothetical protein [Cedecea davisae]MBU4685404.1 hypothetical protein [Cedecea davisae]